MMKPTLLAVALAVAMPAAVFAQSVIEVHDPYARASGPSAVSGAAFMVLHNHGDVDDRLVSASSPVAARVELHTHIEDDAGVMRMVHVDEGLSLPAGGERSLVRGGDHVMFLGITTPFEDGTSVPLTLTFEQAGDVTIEVPVDLSRMPGGHGEHGGQDGHGMTTGN
nr:copper chaperone PCu(A)C [Phycocomes zhengii]